MQAPTRRALRLAELRSWVGAWFANLLALIPTSFASTSHIAVTAILALSVFITVTAIGFYKHGAHFLNLFWVASAPTLALRLVLAVSRSRWRSSSKTPISWASSTPCCGTRTAGTIGSTASRTGLWPT
ncbi:MAG: F0F1 ATP synthase subunit A [Chamaesiphon sp. CSU_1_12]|nr:F0F1 ATP synthase subunit A [Chamaesiphon sp. CSU_1_12]